MKEATENLWKLYLLKIGPKEIDLKSMQVRKGVSLIAKNPLFEWHEYFVKNRAKEWGLKIGLFKSEAYSESVEYLRWSFLQI